MRTSGKPAYSQENILFLFAKKFRHVKQYKQYVVTCLKIWRGEGWYISGVHFQKCSNFSIHFFTLNINTNFFHLQRQKGWAGASPLPIYAPVSMQFHFIAPMPHQLCIKQQKRAALHLWSMACYNTSDTANSGAGAGRVGQRTNYCISLYYTVVTDQPTVYFNSTSTASQYNAAAADNCNCSRLLTNYDKL